MSERERPFTPPSPRPTPVTAGLQDQVLPPPPLGPPPRGALRVPVGSHGICEAPSRQDKTMSKGKAVVVANFEARPDSRSDSFPLGVGGAKPSYREDLLRQRSFRPRFPAGQGDHCWYNEETMCGAGRGPSSVWGRLGSTARIHYRNPRFCLEFVSVPRAK
jgi:hypothetical protein